MNLDYLWIFCPIFNLIRKTNHIKVSLNLESGFCFLECPLLQCLSFSSCLLALWLPMWRWISSPWQQQKYAISSPDLPLLSKREWGGDLLDTYISWWNSLHPGLPFWHIKYRDKTQMTGSESVKTRTKYTALEVDS